MKPIPVVKSFLPNFEEVSALLKTCWDSHWLTNNGPLLQQLEAKYTEFLGVERALCVSNGTVALQIALKALDIKGKVITTPYSYVATSRSLLWENCTPVFADISVTDFNIDPDKIEELIDSETSAILAVHVYGFPCDVERLQSIAERHNLKLIYDSAHAFGVRYNDKPIAQFGDISTFSLHATKLVHAGEGGIIACSNKENTEKVCLLRAFGHVGDEHYTLGINGKMNELQAALGLAVMKYQETIFQRRRQIFETYQSELASEKIRIPAPRTGSTRNYSYFPVVFDTERERDFYCDQLSKLNILTRKYFWPSLNTLSYMPKKFTCPTSESVSRRVLCLPMYTDLGESDIGQVIEGFKQVGRLL